MIVAVLAQKGGCGKTTLATNLAAAAFLETDRTLLVDLDRQGSSEAWAENRLWEAPSPIKKLQVATASKPLTRASFDELADEFDHVVMDGPPRLDDVTLAAAVFADVAVIPVLPSHVDFWTIARMIELLGRADAIRRQMKSRPVRRVLVLNRAGTRRLTDEGVKALGGVPGMEFGGIVRSRVAFVYAMERGDSVLTGGVAAEDAAEDIRQLWRFLKGSNHAVSRSRKKTRVRESRG